MHWLVLLLLAGCATPYNDLLATATSCGGGHECQELWDEINKRDEARIEREKRDFNPCPQGYVHVIDGFKRETCVSRSEIRQIFH